MLAVARHYDATVKPQHRGTGGEAILARLGGGDSEAQLRRAADAYAVELDAAEPPKQPCHRQTANTFFGTEPRAKYPTYRDRPARTTVTAAERPDLVPAAHRILAKYKKVVGSSHPDAGAEPIVLALLADGVAEETLLGAVERYGRHCERPWLDANARKGAPRFFGRDWQDYCHGPPKAVRRPTTPLRVPVSPEERAAGMKLIAEAQKAWKAREGTSNGASPPLTPSPLGGDAFGHSPPSEIVPCPPPA